MAVGKAVKPGRWSLNPGGVDPAYQGLWRGLIVCLPLWEGSGTPFDYAGRFLSEPEFDVTVNAWTPTERGTALEAGSTGANNDAWYLTRTGGGLVMPTSAVTVFLHRQKTDSTLRGSSGFGARNGASRFGCHLPWSDGNVYWDFGGTGSPNRLTYTGGALGDNLWCFTAGAPGSAIWKNGERVASQSTGVSRTNVSTERLMLNRDDNASALDFVRMDVFYMWDRVLTDPEIEALFRDPYGMVRPAPLLAAADVLTLDGTLFQKAPTFFTGQVTGGAQVLDGVLFTKAATFPTGTLSSGAVLLGASFTKAPTFFTGAVTGADLALQGALFTSTPTFSTGLVTGGAQTLTGSLWSPTASFFVGGINAAGSGAFTPTTTDEGLRFEVWSMPQLGTFTRKYDLTRYVNAFTVSDKFGEISDGTLTIADSLPIEKLDQLIKVDRANHANDEGSVVRVLRGTTPIIHYVTKQYDDTWSSDDPTANLKLEGMELLLDRVIVPRKDYPTVPSVEPDWIYGAQSILTNTAFDNSGVTSSVVTLEINATAGTFLIQTSYPNGDPFVSTANIPFNATAQNIADAIEAAGDIADVLVSGAGTTSNPFVIEVLDPAGEEITWATDSGLLTGLASIGTITAGGNLATEPWTRSVNPTTGIFHGSYTTFEISTEQFHSAPNSLKIDGDPPATEGAFPGAQQLISVTPGRTYRASVWVYPTNQAAFRFVIRTRDETFIAAENVVLTANSWQEISIPVVTIPTHVSQIIFRIATISDGDEPAWYVDDALFAPGEAAATYGAIMSDILAPIQANGLLTWLTPTWTDTTDSAGVPWDRDLEWAVKRGQTILQLMEYARKWNYEWRLRWDNAQLRFEWDLFNPTSGGTDHTGSGLAIMGRGISSSGLIARRFPEASYYQAEGDLFHWGEHEDTTMSGAWGRLEQYFANAQGLDAEGLEELATRLVTDSINRVDGLQVRLQVPTALPWSKFNPGDKLKVNLEPQRDGEILRCLAVVASQGQNDAVPAYDVHFGSVVYQGEAAVLQTLRILWREFKALQTTQVSRDTIVNPVLPSEPDVITGADTAIVIAAHNTNAALLPLADYICSGTNDQDTIMGALADQGPFDGDDFTGAKGVIKFLSGDYYFDDRLILADTAFGKLTFQGEGMPIWHLRHNTITEIAAVAPMILCAGSLQSQSMQLRFVNIHFEGGNHSNGVCFAEWTTQVKPWMHVESCYFTNWDQHIWWSERQVQRIFRNNYLLDCDLISVMHMEQFAQGAILLTGSIFQNCTGNFISGGAIAGETLIHGNIQVGGGTIAENVVSLVTYADNVGF